MLKSNCTRVSITRGAMLNSIDVRVYRYIDIWGAMLKSRRTSVSIYEVLCWNIIVREYRLHEVRYWTLDVRVYQYIDIWGAILNSRRASVSIIDRRVGCWTPRVRVYRLHEVRYGTPVVGMYRSIDTGVAICVMYRYTERYRSHFSTDRSVVLKQ
jgi:hypothetical protein